MAALVEQTAVLRLQENPTYLAGARFVGTAANHPQVTVELVRWMELGYPREITVTIRAVDSREPVIR